MGQIMTEAEAMALLAKLEVRLDRPAKGRCSLKKLVAMVDKAKTVRQFAEKSAWDRPRRNRAIEVEIRAARKAGKLLGKRVHRGGDQKSHRAKNRMTLRALGVSRGQSRLWRRLAAIPDPLFSACRKQLEHQGKVLSFATFLRYDHGCACAPNAGRRFFRPSQLLRLAC